MDSVRRHAGLRSAAVGVLVAFLALAVFSGSAAGGEGAEAADDIEKTPIGLADGARPAGEEDNEPLTPPYLDMLRLMGSLALVIGLVVAAAWGLKRLAPRSSGMFSSETVKVLARTYLAPRQMVCLLKVPGKLLVVGSTAGGIATLAEIADPVEVERVLGSFEKSSARGASATFRNLLASVTGGGEDSRSAHEEAGAGGLAATVDRVSDRIAVLNNRLEVFEDAAKAAEKDLK